MTIGESQNQLAESTAPGQGDTANLGTADNMPAGDDAPEENQEPKTYTQEEVDAMVQKRLGIEKRRMMREQTQRVDQPRTPAAEPPKPDQFKTAQEYIDAVSDWKADQKVAEREQRSHQNATVNAFAERAEKARDKYPDFDDVVGSDDVRITKSMAQVIMESEIGPEVAYYLGKNPKEADRIADLSPLAQAREIGKIEATLAKDQPEAAKKVTSAPDPIKPVKNGGTPPKYSTSDPRSTQAMPPSEWIAQRNKELAAKHK